MPQAATQNLLSKWIAAEHLTDSAISAAGQRLLRQQYVVIDNFLVEKVADRSGKFLENEVSFSDIVNIVTPGRRVSDDEWASTAQADRIERTRVCPVVLPQFRVTTNTAAFLQLRTKLRSAEMAEFMSRICDEKVTGVVDAVGYARKMVRGDFIREHDDESSGRVAALIVHLSRNWGPRDGGALHLRLSAGDTVEIPTGWNRAVIMKVDNKLTHAVTDIAGPGQRFTIQNWFVRAG